MKSLRRKPPRHLPKSFPSDHELADVMTPTEWVGCRLQELWENEIDIKNNNNRANLSQNYDAYFLKEGKNIRCAMRGKSFEEWKASDECEDHMYAVAEAIAKDLANLKPDQRLSEKQEQKYLHLLSGDTSPGRLIPSASKPQDRWPSIYDKVRSEVMERFGIEISNGKLKKCLDSYRDLIRSIKI